MPGPVATMASYDCALCKEESFTTVVAYGDADDRSFEATKWGHWPALATSPPRELAKAIGSRDAYLIKKANACLNHGYGIGAAAYFRRVVENSTHLLVDLLEQEALESGDTKLAKRIAEARGKQPMQDRLSIVASCVPDEARHNGANPLKILYEQYSLCLHQQSDEDAVGTALKMKAVLEYVFPKLTLLLKKGREYRKAIAATHD